MQDIIRSHISAECPWRDTLHWYDTIDSTNTRAKELAKAGAPHGTVLIAGTQTGGRGRLGRSFSSPAGIGVYLSVILRPQCKPEELMHLTCAAGVAACQAVEKIAGICPDIKWANDLVWKTKKLGGILTELGIGFDRTVEYAVVGIGINCNQSLEDFPKDLQPIATSVRQMAGNPCSPALLAGALVESLYQMDSCLLSKQSKIMNTYRAYCITTGSDVSVVQGDVCRHGTALEVDDDGGLLVRFADGTVKAVSSGEVSIRGMYGYV